MHIKKYLLFFLAVVLSFTYSIQLALAVAEDLTTYTEVDANGRISVSATTANVTALTRAEDAYLYYDYGAGYFSASFSIDFDFNAIRTTDAGTTAFFISSMANSVDDFKDIDDASGDAITVGYKPSLTASYYWIDLLELDGGTQYADTTGAGALSYGTTYYYTMYRNDNEGDYGTIYLYIYSDDARTSLIDTLSVALHSSKKDYRYLYAVQSLNTGDAGITGTGQFVDFEVSTAVGSPIVSTVNASNLEYDTVFGYQATLNGTIDDDGGENAYASFYYRIKDSPSWSWGSTGEAFGTSDNFSLEISGLILGETYEFYAFAYNSGGSDNGSILEFDMELESDVPTMLTLSYPFNYDRDTDTATIYGTVQWDGNSTSNVTGYFEYKETGAGSWLVSANETELETGDTYHIDISGLSILTDYSFRAVGINDDGTGYGAIASFIIGANITAPTMTTDNVSLITDTSAYLYGTCTDNGSTSVIAKFQYRIAGTSTWTNTYYIAVDVDEQFLIPITGLIPDTNYEYRAVGETVDVATWETYIGYGSIKTFASMASISIPIISTDNITFLMAGVVDITGSVVYDGGSTVTMYFQARELGTSTWTDSEHSLVGYETGDSGSWYISGLINGKSYQARAVGYNAVGTGYGNILSFVMSEDVDVGDGDDTDPTIQGFVGLVNQLRSNLGMTGAMGTWAFMGLLLLIIAIIFGCGAFAVKDSTGRTMIIIIWGLISIAVVGGFVFTGELGVMPIVVMVSIFAVFCLAILGRWLSGNKGGEING